MGFELTAGTCLAFGSFPVGLAAGFWLFAEGPETWFFAGFALDGAAVFGGEDFEEGMESLDRVMALASGNLDTPHLS